MPLPRRRAGAFDCESCWLSTASNPAAVPVWLKTPEVAT